MEAQIHSHVDLNPLPCIPHLLHSQMVYTLHLQPVLSQMSMILNYKNAWYKDAWSSIEFEPSWWVLGAKDTMVLIDKLLRADLGGGNSSE